MEEGSPFPSGGYGVQEADTQDVRREHGKRVGAGRRRARRTGTLGKSWSGTPPRERREKRGPGEQEEPAPASGPSGLLQPLWLPLPTQARCQLSPAEKHPCTTVNGSSCHRTRTAGTSQVSINGQREMKCGVCTQWKIPQP